MKQYLKKTAADYGFALTEGQIEDFALYAKELVEWNEKINLTAITEPDQIVEKHFVDSLLLLKAVEIPEGTSLIDVGTGAGFPSIPCRIVRTDLKVTLLDSLAKRLSFLTDLSGKLSQDNQTVHGRAEEVGKDPAYREQFGLVTARAVANLQVLSEYCLPFTAVGGIFVAMKGDKGKEEAMVAEKAIALLGGQIERIESFTLPQGDKREIVVIRKISQTSSRYPRMTAKIKKSPLG